MSAERELLDRIPEQAEAFCRKTIGRIAALNEIVSSGRGDELTMRELEETRRAVETRRSQVAAWRGWLEGRLAALAAEENGAFLFGPAPGRPQQRAQARLELKA